MKRFLITGVVLALCTAGGFAQEALSPNVVARMAQVEQTPAAELVSDVPYKLPWDFFAERDVVWKKRVWRVIDASAAGNELFVMRSAAGTPLFAAMLRGVVDEKIKAYSTVDDRFTTVMEPDLVKKAMEEKFAKPGKAEVSGYMVKEEWLYSVKGTLEVRILGIAPLVKDAKGEDVPLFWLFYPDGRKYMAGIMADAKENWDELMEKRHFKSKITKEGNASKGHFYPKDAGK